MPWGTWTSSSQRNANPYAQGGALYGTGYGSGGVQNVNVNQPQSYGSYNQPSMYQAPMPNYFFNPASALNGLMGGLTQPTKRTGGGARVGRPAPSVPQSQPQGAGSGGYSNANQQYITQQANQMRQMGDNPVDPQLFALPSVSSRAQGELMNQYQDVRRAQAYRNAADFERQGANQLQPLLAGQANFGLQNAGFLAQMNGQQYQNDLWQQQMQAQQQQLLQNLLRQIYA